MLVFCVCIECMMIGRKLMGLEGFTDIFNEFFSARVHQCLRHVSIYLLSVFCMGPSLYYVSERTGWVGSENGKLFSNYTDIVGRWVGQKKSKNMLTQ